SVEAVSYRTCKQIQTIPLQSSRASVSSEELSNSNKGAVISVMLENNSKDVSSVEAVNYWISTYLAFVLEQQGQRQQRGAEQQAQGASGRQQRGAEQQAQGSAGRQQRGAEQQAQGSSG